MPSLKAPVPPAWPELFSLHKWWRQPRALPRLLKLFMLIFLPLTGVGMTLLFAVLHLQEERQLNIVSTQEMGQVQVAARYLSHDIEMVSSDLMVLAHAPSMALYMEQQSETNRMRLAELFRDISNEKQLYDQIRFIDASGMEQVRVNFTSNGAVIVPDEELQPKWARYYFRDSITLDKGEIYVSPLDLNIEHQQLEIPYKPMLRLATPVFDRKGGKRGVVVLNVFGKQLLDDFTRAMGEKRHAMLLNNDGYWLSHPNANMEWGFMLNRETSLATSAPEVWKRLESEEEGSFTTAAGLYTFKTVYPLLGHQHSSTGSARANGSSRSALEARDYFWKVVSLVPRPELPIGVWHDMRNNLAEESLILLLLAVVSALLAIVWLNHRQWQQAVFENETRLREITATLGEGVYVLDRLGRVTFVNPEAERMLGWSAGELLGRNGHHTFHHHSSDGAVIAVEECPVHKTIRTGQVYRSLHDCLIRKDGSMLPVSIVSTPIMRQGEIAGSVAAFQDITVQLETERTLREAETLFRSALEHAPIGMAIVALDGNFTKVNRVLCRITGYSKQELERLTFAEISHPDDLDADLDNVQRLLSGEIDSYQMEKRYIRKNGEVVWVQLNGSVLRDAEQRPLYFLAQVEDITERKEYQEQIRKLAFYDTLTGLPNRRLFLDHFDQALTQAKRFKRSLAVMFIDLDHFKEVNDTFGHKAGDELLQEVARRLIGSVRHGDTVCRQGGDEFVIVLAEIAHPDDASQVADKILSALNLPFTIQRQKVQIGASIGIAIYPVAGSENIQELMKRADRAMYVAKEAGRNQYSFAVTDNLKVVS